MNRNEIITKVKELGLVTEKPAHQCKTDYLEKLLSETHGVSIKQKGKSLSDKHKKILSDKMKGFNNPKAKFTEKDILNIRNLYENRKTNKLNQTKIAKMYNTDQGTISAIINKKKWNYV